MLHLRVYCPAPLVDDAAALLNGDEKVTAVARIAGGSVRPPGDLLIATLPRTDATRIMVALAQLGVTREGTIEIAPIESWMSRRGLRVAERAGDEADAVVWPEVIEQAYDNARATWGFFAFMIMATLIAAIAIFLDSQVLVIGAMVLGPEFGAVAALGIALVARRWHLLRSGISALVLGFGAAIAVTTLFTLLLRAMGWVTETMVDAPRPLTNFIYRPDKWSLIVAVVAGIAGMIALATQRSTTLAGVFISVTTIPAAGNAAVALAFGDWSEMLGSLAQLGINIAGMTVSGWLTIVVMGQLGWRPHRWTMLASGDPRRAVDARAGLSLKDE